MQTIGEAISYGARQLEAAADSHPRPTAGVLLAHRLGVDRTHLLTHPEATVAEADYQAFLHMIERRAAGEPLQYITGHQEFYKLDFVVSPAVLIPRPETEFLVERVLTLAGGAGSSSPLIIDAGTGSGCIAVSLAVGIADARVIATDVSAAALAVAAQNARRHGVGGRVEFYEGDLLAPLAGLGLEQRVDYLASNPPYVEAGRPELVQREVREYEPQVALFGGADGLDFYRRLLVEAVPYVKPGGYMAFEIGYSQMEAIAALIGVSPWELVDITHDLQGIPRTLTIRKASGNR